MKRPVEVKNLLKTLDEFSEFCQNTDCDLCPFMNRDSHICYTQRVKPSEWDFRYVQRTIEKERGKE